MALTVIGGLGFAFLFVLILGVLVRRIRNVIAHGEITHDRPGQTAEGFLVIHGLAKAVQRRPCLGFDLGAQGVHQGSGGLGRR